MSDPNAWDTGVRVEVDSFVSWMSRFRNQHGFVSLQGAYESWLIDEGFVSIRGDYSMAVQVILVYLSCCIANPLFRRYLSNPDDEPDEFTVVQINVPEEGEERTFWEFFAEENFRQMYRRWLRHQKAED